MKLLLDFFPIILFFIIYKNYGINIAIASMIVATIIQIIYTRYHSAKFEKMQIIALIFLIIFGGLTIYINNPAFIMWKVSILYVVFAIVLLASLLSKTSLLERLMAKQINVPKKVWSHMTLVWGAGFIIIALINAYFVVIALRAREQLIAVDKSIADVELSVLDCNITSNYNICIAAQQAEQSWVNFKLFGTLILTVLLIAITIFMIRKYVNAKNNTI